MPAMTLEWDGNLTPIYICWLIENLIFSLLLQKNQN